MSMKYKIGDKVIIWDILRVEVEEIIGEKIYFRDQDGRRWHVSSDNELILDDNTKRN